MSLPANNKQVGDTGHADDHNAIVNEINLLISASINYLPASASSNYLQISNASATYLLQSVALNTYLPISASSNYLQVNASANFLPISASSNYLPISASSNYLPMSASSNFATATISINAQTGTSYTLAASDSGKIVEMNNAGANLVIIPLNSTVPIPVGTQIEIIQTGAGATSASIVSGVTLNSEAGKRTINAQWQGASLIKRATDTWVMMGAIKA